MRGFARTVIAGNLGADPDLRYTPNGTPVANFSVAVNRKESKGGGEYEDVTDWYRVTIFGKQAEIADEYLRKGAPVLIDGRPQIEHWTGQDGQQRTTVKIIADTFLMLGGRDDAEGNDAAPARTPQRAPASAGGSATGQSAEGWSFDDDLNDVPF